MNIKSYINKIQLSYFYSKLKIWCTNAFATLIHSHEGTEVTLTGYAKANSKSAITTSDTVNSSIGKLEYKVDSYDDSNYVHKTGDEEINGTKVFKDRRLRIRSTSTVANQTFSDSNDTRYNTLWFEDKTGEQIAGVELSFRYNGTADFKLLCRNPASDLSDWSDFASIYLGYDSNGEAYASCPTVADTTNNTRIANTYWVRRYCETTKKFLTSQTQLSLSTSGSGNAITTLSVSNHAITATKGTTFLTSHQSLANYVTLNSEQTISRGKVFWYWSAFKDQDTAYAAGAYDVIQFRDKNDLSYGLLKVFGASDGSTAYYQFVLVNPKNTSSTCTIELTVSNSTWTFCPVGDNDNSVGLGSASRRWKQLYAGTATIGTSDKRLKNSISNIPDDVLDAWNDINWVQFKYNDASKEKPIDKVRLHTGLIAQDIEKIMSDANVDISRYGLFCYDKWDHENATYDNNGNIIRNEVQPGDVYSIRYEEALCMEAAYQRRKIKQLEEEIVLLKEEIKLLKEFMLNK